MAQNVSILFYIPYNFPPLFYCSTLDTLLLLNVEHLYSVHTVAPTTKYKREICLTLDWSRKDVEKGSSSCWTP